jgi:hypothetical protein
MRLSREGAHRRVGTTLLFSEDIQKLIANRWKRPIWNGATGEFHIEAYGSDRGSRYNYRLTLSAADLIALFQLASAALPEIGSRAIGIGSLSSLHELLVPKNDEKAKN